MDLEHLVTSARKSISDANAVESSPDTYFAFARRAERDINKVLDKVPNSVFIQMSLASLYSDMGESLIENNNIPESINYLKKSIATIDNIGNITRDRLYLELANDGFQEYTPIANPIHLQDNMNLIEAIASRKLSEIYTLMGNTPEAQKYWKNAGHKYEEILYKTETSSEIGVISCINFSDILLQDGHRDKAMIILSQAQEIVETEFKDSKYVLEINKRLEILNEQKSKLN